MKSHSYFATASGFEVAVGTPSASVFQLYNNQDGTYAPPKGVPQPRIVQGFGFYESSGGLSFGAAAVTIRTYINNNLPEGTYKGSYQLKTVSPSSTTVKTIYYKIVVKS